MHHMTILLLAAMQATAYVSRVSGYFTTAYARFRKRLEPQYARYTLANLPVLAGGAATKAISTRTRGQAISRIPYPVAATSQIWKSTLVAINASGYAVAASDSGTDIYTVGVAESSVLGGSSNGDKWITVLSGGVFEFTATSITQAMIGTIMYVVDDETIDDVAGVNQDVPCGILVEFVDSTTGWISIGIGGVRAEFDSVVTGDIAGGAVTTVKLGADAVTGDKLADNAVDSEHYTDGSIESIHLEASLIRYTDTQLTASELNNVRATNIELVATPGANLAVIPVAVHMFLDHGGADFVQTANGDQLALIYNASTEIVELGSEAQCTTFLEASADAALFDPIDADGLVPEANKAIDLDNNGSNEYTTGNGTLSIRVYYITVPIVAFS